MSDVFWKTSDVFIGCLEKNEPHFRGGFYRLPVFVFSTSLARARARTPCIFALFAFTIFTKTDVVYWNTVKCEGIRNGVLQKSTKVRLVETMKGGILEGEIAWFASHFYENSTPNCEGCESKKCMFAGNARAYAEETHPLFFFIWSESLVLERGVAPSLLFSSLWILLFSRFILFYCKV